MPTINGGDIDNLGEQLQQFMNTHTLNDVISDELIPKIAAPLAFIMFQPKTFEEGYAEVSRSAGPLMERSEREKKYYEELFRVVDVQEVNALVQHLINDHGLPTQFVQALLIQWVIVLEAVNFDLVTKYNIEKALGNTDAGKEGA